MACASRSARKPGGTRASHEGNADEEAGNGGARLALRTAKLADTGAQRALALKWATAKPFDPSRDVNVKSVGREA